MLLPRVLTGLIGIPALLFLIYHGGVAYTGFVVAIVILCLYEYGVILTLGRRPVRLWLCVAGGGAMAVFVALGFPVQFPLAALTLAAIISEMAAKQSSLERLSYTVFGAAFFGVLPAYLGPIRDFGIMGRNLSFFLFICIWSVDTAAYAAGKALGSHRLAPVLSPKKTWEGSCAGFLAALIVAAVFSFLNTKTITLTQALLLGAVIGIFAQVSDLAQSLIKRSVGVKDSGAILPGHGGIMDRFDSFLLAAPIFYYCLIILGLRQ